MYYYIDHRTDKEVGSVYPQIRFNNLKEAFKFRHNLYPEQAPSLSATLEKGAKLTDILSQGSITGHGLLINDKVKNILGSFKVMEHKFYDCPVKDHNGNIHQYYWMALVQPNLIELINFNKSKFYTTEAGFREDNISLESFEDYTKKKSKLPNHAWSIKAEIITLTSQNLDFSVLPNLFIKILVSEGIKDIFLKEKISGIELKEAPIKLINDPLY